MGRCAQQGTPSRPSNQPSGPDLLGAARHLVTHSGPAPRSPLNYSEWDLLESHVQSPRRTSLYCSMFLPPQGSCTCCSLCPGCASPTSSPGDAYSPFEPQLQCHFLRKAFPDHHSFPTWKSGLSLPTAPRLPPCPFHSWSPRSAM